ncbi:MAG: hypothetical protein AB7K37_06660 [Cyclobacteriaceae bacterium]
MHKIPVLLLLTLLSLTSFAQNWASLDAVVYNNKEDKYFFFFGKFFVMKERGQYIDGLPLSIKAEWESFPKSWGGGNLDAVCYSADNDKYYFFKGDEVAETVVTNVSVMGATTIKIPTQKLGKPMKFNASNSGFKGIPWPRIDAATYNSETNTYYFFYGDEYVSKKRGEPVDAKIRKVGVDGFLNLDRARPFKGVDFSADNKEYYFFWDEYYMTKEQGKEIAAGTKPRTYAGDGQKGFEWAERSNNNFVGFANESGYLANFKVSWTAGGKEGSWSKKGTALTYENRVSIPKNATDITIAAYVYDEFDDNKNGKRIFSESMNIPPNKWYKVYGTVFEPKHKVDKKSSNLMGSVTTFFTKDIGNAVEDAGEFFEDAFQDAQRESVKLLAKADFDKRKDFIDKFGAAATKVVAEPATIQALLRVARAKDAKVAADAMRNFVNHPAFNEVKKAMEFKSMSIGFTSGASTVIGMEGSFGYGVAIAGPNNTVKGYAGLDSSLGVQDGLGLGCQFGIWKNPPTQLSGNSVAVNIEVGAGAGIACSIVYDMTVDPSGKPTFTFGGIVVTPGVGAGVGASVGTGYSWVF